MGDQVDKNPESSNAPKEQKQEEEEKGFIRTLLAHKGVLFVLFMIVGMYALIYLTGLLDLILNVLEWLTELPWYESLPIYSVSYFFLVHVFFPRSLYGIAAGLIYGPIGGILVESFTALGSGIVIFIIGKRYFRDSIVKRVQASPKLQAIDKAIELEGLVLIAFLRTSAVTNYVVNNGLIAVSSASWTAKIVGSYLGLVPWSTVYVMISQSVGAFSDLKEGTANAEGEAATAQTWLTIFGIFSTVIFVVLLGRKANQVLDEAMQKGTKEIERERRESEQSVQADPAAKVV